MKPATHFRLLDFRLLVGCSSVNSTLPGSTLSTQHMRVLTGGVACYQDHAISQKWCAATLPLYRVNHACLDRCVIPRDQRDWAEPRLSQSPQLIAGSCRALTMAALEEAVPRRQFTVLDDIKLLREVNAEDPFKNSSKWSIILKNLRESTNKDFS